MKFLRPILPLLVGLIPLIFSSLGGWPRSVSVAAATGNTISIADDQFPDTLNPLQGRPTVDQRIIDLMWDPLVGFDDHSQPFGDLAQSVPTLHNHFVSEQNGQFSVTIVLKQGLKWSDGQPITSADVQFGWQVEMDTQTGPRCAGTCDAITSIDTPDASTAVLHFNGIYGDYLSRLPMVLPEHAFSSASQAAGQLGLNPSYNYENASYVTSGPYQVTNFANNDRIELVPNQYYSALPGPYLSGITFQFYANPAAMIAAAASQATDETEDYTAYQLHALAVGSPSRYTVHVAPSFQYAELLYNTVASPLDDVRVRQALNMAVDRSAVCQAALSMTASDCNGLLQEGPFTPVSPVASHPASLGYDPASAKPLLAAGGYSGQTITITTLAVPEFEAAARVIQQAWDAIGVASTVVAVPPGQLSASWTSGGALATGNFQVALFTATDSVAPDRMVSTYGSRSIPSATSPPSSENWGRVADPQVDADFATAAGTVDDTQRQQDFASLAQRIVSQAYMLALFDEPNISTNDRQLGNFVPNPSGNSWNAFEWYSTLTLATPPTAFNPGAQSPASHLCGRLTGDMTLSAVTGAYQMDCNVLVPAGVTLTIEPGVTLYAADNTRLQVAGRLIADGTSTSRVTFQPCPDCFDAIGQPWGGIQFVPGAESGSSISSADISYARTGIADYPGSTLTNDSFRDNGTGLAVGVSATSTLSLSQDGFEHNAVGLSVQGLGRFRLSNSTVADNQIGLALSVQSSELHLNDNNIEENSSHSIVTSGLSTFRVDAADNWWGTADTTSIRQAVVDCQTDLTLPCVEISPLLPSPVCGTPGSSAGTAGSCVASVATSTPGSTTVPMPDASAVPSTPAATSTRTTVVSRKSSGQKRQVGLTFAFLVVQHSTCWSGAVDRIALQANRRAEIGVTVSVHFPNNKAETLRGHTGARGYWVGAFAIPSHLSHRYPIRVPIIVELHQGKLAAKRVTYVTVVG